MSNDMAKFFGALADAPVRDDAAKLNELLAEGRKARERFDAALARTNEASPSQPYVETAHRVMSGLQERLNAAERGRDEAQKSASVLIAVLESLAPRLTAEECAKACAEILAGAVTYVPAGEYTDVLAKLDAAMTERDAIRDAHAWLVRRWADAASMLGVGTDHPVDCLAAIETLVEGRNVAEEDASRWQRRARAWKAAAKRAYWGLTGYPWHRLYREVFYENQRLTKERDEAKAEVERLRAMVESSSAVLRFKSDGAIATFGAVDIDAGAVRP